MSTILNFAVFSVAMAAATAVLYLLSRITGNRFSAASRYVLWAIVVVRMCIPLILFPTVITFEAPATQAVTEYVPAENDVLPSGSVSEPNAPEDVSPATPSADHVDVGTTQETVGTTSKPPSPDVLIPAVYLSICAVILTVRLTGYNVTMRKIRRSLTEPDENTASVYAGIIEKEGIKHVPELCVSNEVSGPLLCGFFKKRIVLTEKAISSGGLENVLRHELIHLKRGDLFMKLLGTLCLSVNFLNPAAYAAVTMMDREMEYSCDERVLAGCDEEKRCEYGETVLAVIRENRTRRFGSTLTTEFVSRDKGIVKRFRMIMDSKKKKRGVIIVAAALLVCIVAGSVISFRAARPSELDKNDPIPVEDTGETETDAVSEKKTETERQTETEPETEADTETGTNAVTEPDTNEPDTTSENPEPEDAVDLSEPAEWLKEQIKSDYAVYCGYSAADGATIADCYGTYNGATALIIEYYYEGSRKEEVAGYTFEYVLCNPILVWKDGRFYTLDEAYGSGILTAEHIGTIHSLFTSSELGMTFEGITVENPDEWVLNTLRDSIYNKYGDICNGCKIYITEYYGTYGGSIAFNFKGGPFSYSQMEVREEIAGFRFEHPDSRTTLIWNNGNLYSISGAYDLGLLTKEDVGKLAYVLSHNLGLHPETYVPEIP